MEVRSPLQEIAVNKTTSEQRSSYNKYIHEAKSDIEKENLYSAWKGYKKAYGIVPSEKVASKISKLEKHMTTYNLWPDTKQKQSDSEGVHSNTSSHDQKENQTSSQDQAAGSDVVTSYNNFIQKAKGFLQRDEVYEAYLCYHEAQQLHPSEKMERKLAKMKVYLEENNIFPARDDNSNKTTSMEGTPSRESAKEQFDKTGAQKQKEPSPVKDEESVNSPDLPVADKVAVFRKWVKEGKQLLTQGQFFQALDLYRKASQLVPGEEIQKRIRKIENYIHENNIEREDNSSSSSKPSPKSVNLEQSQSDLKTPHKTVPDYATRSTPAQQETGSSESGIGSQSEEDKFRDLYQKAKECMESDQYRKALNYYTRAQALFPSDKLQRRINKLQEHLAEEEQEVNSSQEVGDDMVHMGNGFYLFKDMFNSLYAHQRQGILWMWGLYKQGKGGILGDDMGLGKTIQVIGFLSGMFDAEKIKAVLIVLPVAVIINWEREFEKWAPGLRVDSFHGPSKSAREKAMQKVARKGGVVLTSYGMLQRPQNTALLAEVNGRQFVWDYVILDEGHKIKNPSNKCSKGVHTVPARNRILLTGTPIQNNLKEMWTLFDWTHQGSLLGTAKTFSMQFEQPIARARQKDATAGEHRLGQEMANSLKNIIQPFFLRRTKAEVSRGEKQRHRQNGGAEEGGSAKTPHMPTMSRKNDLICWVFLSDIQQKIYEDFISQPDVKQLLNSSQSPLTALNQLKKICDHPRLMTTTQCLALGLHMDEGIQQMETLDEETSKASAVARINHIPDHILVEESGKMVFLVQLLDNLKAQGHRCLVFSQSRKMLDIIQKVMGGRGHKIARLDGTMRHLYEREDIIKRFSRDRSYSIFLLTTQVGGVGLTLTAADRVVIFDPSWNPATDAQAVDRAFRIGQEKNVVIYRLITCGSVEEKIYRRQIFKDSITKQTTGDSNNPYKYFSRQELHELFVLDNPKQSATQVQLNSLHEGQRNTDTHLDEHIAFLHTLDMFGISDHDLMFNKEAHHSDEEEHADEGNDYIQNRVAQANRLIALEAEENLQQTQQTGKYAAPEVFADRPERPSRAIVPGSLMNPVKTPESSPDVVTVDNDSSEESLNKTMGHMSIVGKHSPQSPTPPESSDESADDEMDTNHSSNNQMHDASQDISPGVQTPYHGNHGNLQQLSEEEQIKMAMQMSMLEAKEAEKRILAQIQSNRSKQNSEFNKQGNNASFFTSDERDTLQFMPHTDSVEADKTPDKQERKPIDYHSVEDNGDENIQETGQNNTDSSPTNMETEAENIVNASNRSMKNKSVNEESSDSFKSMEEDGKTDSRVMDVNILSSDGGNNETELNNSDRNISKSESETDVQKSINESKGNSSNKSESGVYTKTLSESEAEVSTTEVNHSAQVSFESVNKETLSNGEEMEMSNHGNTDDDEVIDSSSGDESIVEEDKGAQVSFESSESEKDRVARQKNKPRDSMYKDIVSSDEENLDTEDDLPSLNAVKRKNPKKNVIDSDSSEENEIGHDYINDSLSKNDRNISKNESTRNKLADSSDSSETMPFGGDEEVKKKDGRHKRFVGSESENEDKMDQEERETSEINVIDRSRTDKTNLIGEKNGTEQNLSSPQKSAGVATSAINKRALTPRDTPVANKRRRSVNVGLTPQTMLPQGVASPRPVVIKEELVFSPRATEPEVTTAKAKEDWFSGEGELEYKEFEKHVESSSTIANSTRMFEDVAKNIFPGSRPETNDVVVKNSDLVSEESSEESESEEELSAEELERYAHCVRESRKQYKSGDLHNALVLVREALQIYAEDEQVRKYALKLQRKAAEAMKA